jgi:hypothetical protein
MTRQRRRGGVVSGIGALMMVAASLMLPGTAEAQYFGRNKVQYDRFDFKVLKTEHFDIYYYSEEADAAAMVGRMAERWFARLSKVFGVGLSSRQPVVLYASHPEFEQTNVIEGEINEATGGVTEGLKRRVVLPLAASLKETDHVLGHELVHAFQYDILDQNAGAMPLWFIEGMAEYLSIGPRDPQTAMWLRDAAREDRLPKLQDLDNPRYFPYRYGHAFWAYVTGRWGDEVIGRIMGIISPRSGPGVPGGPPPEPEREEQVGEPRTVGTLVELFEAVTGRSKEELSAEFHAAIRETYGVAPAPTRNTKTVAAGIIGERTGSGSMNVGPALSPDGTKIAFLSERDRLSIDLYLAEATTGRILRKLVSTAADPHFESLQFLASAGAWDSQSQRLAIASVTGGRPALAIIDSSNGRITQQVKFPELGEIFQPTWSPDGKAIAFSAQVGGFTDLFVHDLGTGQTRRLTTDAFADLQPAWSPDGTRLAFVTDRFSTDLATLSTGNYGLAFLSLADASIVRLDVGLTGNAINPQWSKDGATLYFVGEHNGRRNLWRTNLQTKATSQVTDELTGVAGITPLSPAISVATGASLAAVNVFRDSGYEIRVLDPSDAERPSPPMGIADAGVLPPAVRKTTLVAELLKQPELGLPPPNTFQDDRYRPKLTLLGMGQQIGVSTNSTFGSYVSGGIALQFGDLLGNHLLGVGFSVDGGVKDIAGSVNYLNRTHRWNWGVFGEHVPLLSGTVRSGFDVVQGQQVFVEQTDLQRQTFLQTGALTAYPLSRVMRVEFSTAVRRISFSRELRTRFFDPNTGAFLGEDTTELPSDPPIRLFDVATALVRDTASFGAVSPVLGQRVRLEVSPTFGDLRMTTFTADLRQYVMPVRPITLAGRLLHVGRYGAGGEDPRLVPMFLGYATLVRGYDPNSFQASECTPQPDGSCPEFDRLFGSRLLVFNGEVRAPLVGLFTGKLDYGPVPVELIGFYDAGVAWSRSEQPFASGGREWVASVGAGARVNLFGFAIGEFNLARPLNRAGRGWFFVFNLRPGF